MRLSRRAFVQSTFGVLLLPWMPGRCADWLPAAACPSREELLAAVRVLFGPYFLPGPLRSLVPGWENSLPASGAAYWKLVVYGNLEIDDGLLLPTLLAAGSCSARQNLAHAKVRLVVYLEESCRRGWLDVPVAPYFSDIEDDLITVGDAMVNRQPFRRLHVSTAADRPLGALNGTT